MARFISTEKEKKVNTPEGIIQFTDGVYTTNATTKKVIIDCLKKAKGVKEETAQ